MFKKAQVTYADFLIGLLILILITFIFTQTIINLNSREDKFQELSNDGFAISNSFMSQGYCPTNNCLNDWNNEKGRVGFVKDNRLILNNFDKFTTLLNGADGYKKSKILLGTQNDYIFYFEYNNNVISNIYGKTNNLNGINTQNLIRITRILYYNLDDSGKVSEKGRIVKMIILILGKEKSTLSDKLICEKAQSSNFCGILDDLAPQYRQDCCSTWKSCCSF